AELADDVPVASGEAQLVADRRMIVSPVHLAPNADFGAPRYRPPPFDNADVRPHLPRFVADAANDDVPERVAVPTEPVQRDEHIHFRTDEWMAVGGQRHVWRRGDDARRLAIDAAGEL